MLRNNLFIFRIFAPQDGFVLFFHSGLKIINLVRTGYATMVIQDDRYGTMLNKEKREKKGQRRREKGLRCEGMISCKDLCV